MNHLFQIIDKSNTGIISRKDFGDIFANMANLKIEKDELDSFIEMFWKDAPYGIDYPNFIRIFQKYRIKFEVEKKPEDKTRTVHVSEDTIRIKKNAFDQIDRALRN